MASHKQRTIPDVVASPNGERFAAIQDDIDEERDLETPLLQRSFADTKNGRWRQDGCGHTMLLPSRNNRSINITVDVACVERKDLLQAFHIRITFLRWVAIAIGCFVQHPSAGSVDIVAFLALSHALNDGFARQDVISRGHLCIG